jgi:hypothetical protein
MQCPALRTISTLFEWKVYTVSLIVVMVGAAPCETPATSSDITSKHKDRLSRRRASSIAPPSTKSSSPTLR